CPSRHCPSHADLLPSGCVVTANPVNLVVRDARQVGEQTHTITLLEQFDHTVLKVGRQPLALVGEVVCPQHPNVHQSLGVELPRHTASGADPLRPTVLSERLLTNVHRVLVH